MLWNFMHVLNFHEEVVKSKRKSQMWLFLGSKISKVKIVGHKICRFASSFLSLEWKHCSLPWSSQKSKTKITQSIPKTQYKSIGDKNANATTAEVSTHKNQRKTALSQIKIRVSIMES